MQGTDSVVQTFHGVVDLVGFRLNPVGTAIKLVGTLGKAFCLVTDFGGGRL